MIDCEPITLHESFIICQAFDRSIEDAGSAYYLLRGLEDTMTASDYDPAIGVTHAVGAIHAAAGMIHNLLLTYTALTGEDILSLGELLNDVKTQQESMDAAKVMSTLDKLALMCPRARTSISNLPPEEAIRILTKNWTGEEKGNAATIRK